MIYFRCEQCAAAVRANDLQAGQTIPCARCGRMSVCPHATLATSPRSARSPSITGIALALLGMTIVGWGIFVGWGSSKGHGDAPEVPIAANGSASPADDLQKEILKAAIHHRGDAALARVYDAINARHFNGLLPHIPAAWEPRLAEVGPLAARAFTLEGMFGHIGGKAIILLNPRIMSDKDAMLRALCHEMVHAYLHTIGDSSADHGPAFQSTLKRLSEEGAFPGIVASNRERETLRGWIERESLRLDAERASAVREGEALAVEACEIEEALVRLNARAAGAGAAQDDAAAAWTRRRDAYNSRALELGDRAAQSSAELAAFKAEVERYNLMLSYPDGRDEQEVHAKAP